MSKTVYMLSDAVIYGDFQYAIVPLDTGLISKIKDCNDAFQNMPECLFDKMYATFWWTASLYIFNSIPTDLVHLYDIWDHSHHKNVEVDQFFDVPTVVDCPQLEEIIEKLDDDRVRLDYKHLVVYRDDIAWSYAERFVDVASEGLTTSIPMAALAQTEDYLKTKEKEQEWHSNEQ